METTDPLNRSDDEPTLLDAASWQHIDPRYRWVLRFGLAVRAGFLTLLPGFGIVVAQIPPGYWVAWLTGVIWLVAVLLMVVWVPRRVHFTQYLLRPLEMHMRTGYWWRVTTSVGINRIQHIELTQGPLERSLGLSTLVLYTAGGYQSDLKLPGLATADAHGLKTQLVHQLASEDETGEIRE